MMKTTITILAVVGMGLAFAAISTSQEPAKCPIAKDAKGEMTGPAKPAFQPITIDPALLKQNMQARSEYEELNRKIIARQTKLYDENTTIKDLQAAMREIQKKIDAVLAEDKELKTLKEKFQSVAPAMPIGMKTPPAGGFAPAAGVPPQPADKKPENSDKK